MSEIEVRHLDEPGSPWRHYVSHDNWDENRAQQSVDRLNRTAPRRREYRVIPATPETNIMAGMEKMNLQDCKVALRITRSDGAVVTVDIEQAHVSLDVDTSEVRAAGSLAELKAEGTLTHLGAADF